MHRVTKIIFLGALILFAFHGFSGCGGSGSGGAPTPNINRDADAYFPLIDGATMSFIISNPPDTEDIWNSFELHTYEVHHVDVEFASFVPEDYLDHSISEAYCLIPIGPGVIESGLVAKGPMLLSYCSKEDAEAGGVIIGEQLFFKHGVVILPNPTPDLGTHWLIATTQLLYDGPGFGFAESAVLSAIGTLVSVEDVEVQGKLYHDVLRIDVSGEIIYKEFPIGYPNDTEMIIGMGSYWLAEGVGLIAMEGDCGGWLSDYARIERQQ